jgi:hypothetical protein
MPTNLRQRIKENLELFATCIYIAMSIFLVQVVGSAFQKYVIENKDPLSQVLMAIFSIALWGFLIFILFKISSPFRKFLLRMFGVDSDKTESNKEGIGKKEPENVKETEQEKLKWEFQHRTINS